MSKNDYPVLCGGTFFSLLLAARGQRTSKRDNANGKTDGLLQTELLIELFRIIKPTFNPPSKPPTLKKNVGGYRQCDNNGGSYFAAVVESDFEINRFDERMINEYNQVFSNMCTLVNQFIGEERAEWLVKAVIEVIESDINIEDDTKFNIDGKTKTKLELLAYNAVYLPSFLLGIWHYIVMKVNDNTVGKATFNAWHRKKGENNSQWIFKSEIGSGIKRKTTILPFSDTNSDNVTDESSSTSEEQTTEQDEQPLLNNTGREPLPTELRLSDEYYNLFVLGYEDALEGNRFVFPSDRALNEYITKEVSELFANLDVATIPKIKLLPTLFAYESQLREHPEQESYYGFITDIKMRENGINIYFEKLFTVSQRKLHDLTIKLAIKNLEFNRTHWTIKRVNLLEELTDAGLVPNDLI